MSERSLAERVAETIRGRSVGVSDAGAWSYDAMAVPLADIIEAGAALLDLDTDDGDDTLDSQMANRLAAEWHAALLALAKAVGVEP